MSDDKKAIKFIYKNSKHQLVPLVLLSVLAAVNSVSSICFALFCKYVVDGAVNKNYNKVILFGFLIILLVIIQLSIQFFSQLIQEKISLKLNISYRKQLLNSVFRKQFNAVSKYKSGELLTRSYSDVQLISNGIATIFPNLIGMVTRLICALVVLLILASTFTFVFLILGLSVFFATMLMRKKLKVLHKDAQKKEDAEHSFLNESYSNLLIIKVFGAENKMSGKLDECQKDLYQTKLRHKRWSIFANTGFSFIFRCGYTFALLWGCYGIYALNMSYGTLTAMLQLVGQVQTPFANLSGLIPRIYEMLASAERLMEIVELPDEKTEQAVDCKLIYESMKGIKFNNVDFSYNRNTVISNADLFIEKGDNICITGISGAGKSTLFLLLLSAYSATNGEITIETEDRNYKLDGAFRKLFAYVPQGNLLFSGSLRENISFLNENVTEKEIEEVLNICRLNDFVKELPKGLDTILGEKGFGISEGQAQRIAVARALISGAPILLLDEATSALDETTEAELIKNIAELKSKTCIIVTHRQKAQTICNKQITIENTKVQLKEIEKVIV